MRITLWPNVTKEKKMKNNEENYIISLVMMGTDINMI